MSEFQRGRQPIPNTGRGTATENALSSVFRLILGTTSSELLDGRRNDREGMSDVGDDKFAV